MKIIESSWYKPAPSIVIITDNENVFAKSLISLCIAKNFTIFCVVPDEENAKDLKLQIPAVSVSSTLYIGTKNNLGTNIEWQLNVQLDVIILRLRRCY